MMLKFMIVILMLVASFIAFGTGVDKAENENSTGPFVAFVVWIIVMIIICNMLVYV